MKNWLIAITTFIIGGLGLTWFTNTFILIICIIMMFASYCWVISKLVDYGIETVRNCYERYRNGW